MGRGLTVAEALQLVFEQEAWWQYRAQIVQYIYVPGEVSVLSSEGSVGAAPGQVQSVITAASR